MTRSLPPLAQPPSPDENTGDQLEGDGQVAQSLSLEHVGASRLTSKCSPLIHLRSDKFHARFWIWFWGRFLDALVPHRQTIQVVFCTSCTRQMGSMGGSNCRILECRKIQNVPVMYFAQ